MKIYGWTEQGECSYGIISQEVDGEIIDFDIDEEDGQVFCAFHGYWYNSFSNAKKACLKLWNRRKRTAIQAIKDIKAMRKSET